MEFRQFGHKSFVPQAKIQGFVDHLAEDRVMANQCSHCMKLMFPPRASCITCGSEAMEWVEITGPGLLTTFTTVYYGPAGFENEVPYTIAVISIPGGINVFGKIDRQLPVKEIEVGMELVIEAQVLDNGQFTYIFKRA